MDVVEIGKRSARTAAERRGVYIRTFGCQMNEYDSLKLERLLEPDFFAVAEPGLADLILINTCSVREKPEHKLYSLLGEMAELKQAKPHLLIGVGGCVAQQEGERIVKRNSAVDFVFGTHNLSLVPALISRRTSSGKPQVAVDYRDEWEDLPLGFPQNGRVSVFVAISRGCNKNCTYCIVPVTRGREVSRPIAEIEREIKLAVHRGAKEVVLLGQTVNSYGLDLTPRRRFADLLQCISAIDGVKRIRFTSPHPQEVRRDFVDLVAGNPKICRHIHLPLQSGSDRILKAMNRNYRQKRYLQIVDDLKSRVPDLAITTDIIVGFPGETEGDFLETLKVMERVRFDNSYSFVFSPRPGTPAEKMAEQIPRQEKFSRLEALQSLQNELSTASLRQWVNCEVEVLLDGPSRADGAKLQGRTTQNLTVNLNHEAPELVPGNFVRTRITEACRFTLRGELVAVLGAGET